MNSVMFLDMFYDTFQDVQRNVSQALGRSEGRLPPFGESDTSYPWTFHNVQQAALTAGLNGFLERAEAWEAEPKEVPSLQTIVQVILSSHAGGLASVKVGVAFKIFHSFHA